jgi:hypothetical protein
MVYPGPGFGGAAMGAADLIIADEFVAGWAENGFYNNRGHGMLFSLWIISLKTKKYVLKLMIRH